MTIEMRIAEGYGIAVKPFFMIQIDAVVNFEI